MRTLLRAFLCALVVGAMGGCGGRSDVEIPPTFAPPPAKEEKPKLGAGAPVKMFSNPSAKPGPKNPG
jgi:predicted small lipoprotein YifL